MSAELIGRTDVVRDLMDGLDGTDLVTVTIVTGPTGIGRSALLAEIAHQAAERDLTTLRFTASRHDQTAPFYLTSLLASALSRLPAVRVPVTVVHGDGDSTETERVATQLAQMMLVRPGLVVLLDDIQSVDASSRTVLALLMHRLGPATVRWVCTLRTPVRPKPQVELDRLLTDGRARLVPLSPLSREATDTLVASRIHARPHVGLSTLVRRLSRGVPAALHAAIDGYLRAGTLMIADGHGYLLNPSWTSNLPPDHPLMIRLRDLPAPMWTVAKAMAVMEPLCAQAPRLIAETLGLSDGEVAAALNLLVNEGVLKDHSGGRGWRFTVPLWREVFDDALGPYERRELAQAAVAAVPTAASPRLGARYRAEQLLRCGRYGEPTHFSELFQLGLSEIGHDTGSAARWLSAAAEVTADSRERWSALAAHATASCLMSDFTAAAKSAQALLNVPPADIPSGAMLEVQLVQVIALSGLRDAVAVGRIAEGEQPLGQHVPPAAVARAAALCLLGRWDEAYRMLAVARQTGGPEEDGDELAKIVLAVAGAVTGRPWWLRDLLAEADRQRTRTVVIRVATRLLLVIGQTNCAERLLDRVGSTSEHLAAPDRALLAWQRGRWDEALHQARLGAHPIEPGQPAPSIAPHAVAAIMLGRGRPAMARATLAAARAEPSMMVHMLDGVDVAIARACGDTQSAQEYVTSGLAYAAQHAVLPGTEDLLLHAAELALDRGDLDGARRAVRCAAQVAEIQQTDQSRLLALLSQLAVEGNAGTTREALSLARRLGQPDVLARTLIAVVKAGYGEPKLLREAYDLYGDLSALLYRYGLRQLMRRYDTMVPHRAVTTAENDLLLATLLADGASNRDLAAILRVSMKGVEGMLSRLFARTGFRSRINAATAILTGQYPMNSSPAKLGTRLRVDHVS